MKNLDFPTIDLPPVHWQTLRRILGERVRNVEVWAYGSRATGGAHAGSDLDLVIRNPEQLETAQKNLHRLREALHESNLPILIDVLDWARIPPEFREEIERDHVVVTSPENIINR